MGPPMLASVTRTTAPERFGTEHAAELLAPIIGPCIIQSFQEPHWLPYCDIHATIWLHHDDASPPDSAMPGAVDIHCRHVARIASGFAHIAEPVAPACSCSVIQPAMLEHQSDGGALSPA